MAAKSKAGAVPDPRARQRDLAPTPGVDRPKAASGKHRSRKSTRTARVPSQSRDESRQQPQELQDVEREIAAGAEEERYDVERD